MPSHRPAPPTLQQRLYWPVAVACGAVMLAGTIGAAQAVAPQVAAAEHLALTPERSAEPSAHGGPLAPLSIGVIYTEPGVDVNSSAEIYAEVHMPRPAERPVAVVSSVRVAGTTPAVATPPTVTTGQAIATPVETTTPPTTTAAATTTRTCRWCHHTSPATTTTETTTAATTTEATTTAATETTSETSDPLATLISDVLEEP